MLSLAGLNQGSETHFARLKSFTVLTGDMCKQQLKFFHVQEYIYYR